MGAGIIFVFIVLTFLLSTGGFLIAADRLDLPTIKSSRAVVNFARQDKKKTKNLQVIVLELSTRLSKLIKLDEYKRRKLAATLKSTGVKLSPEVYIAQAWVKAGLVLLGIIPSLIVFPIFAFLILFLSILIYFKEIRSADEAMKKKREAIESELPRFAMTLQQELKASRDVLSILETYRKHASPAFRHELEITTADMRSGSYEAAISRFESRIGSSMLSDVLRGLQSVMRGDDGKVYFQMLAHDFKLFEVQKLKLIAMKRPSKVRKYSFLMLGCFVLMYMGVMAVEIVKTFSTMF